MSLLRFEDGLRARSHHYTHVAEAILHSLLALLLAVGAAVALFYACIAMWHGFAQSSKSGDPLLVIDQLLLVLIFIEILHTVRISIRSEALLMEPFLIVGVIASVRRVLVITMQAAQVMRQEQPDPQAAEQFRKSMWELGLLGALILTLVVSIYLLRRAPAVIEEKLAQ